MNRSSLIPERRALLLGGGAALLIPTVGCAQNTPAPKRTGTAEFAASPFRKITNDEWRKRLPPAAYQVLRFENTEPPWTSALNNEKRRGRYLCLGCDLPLFDSRTKYDSGTGWPSFWQALPGAFGTMTDFKIGYPRKEYHCARCLGHHGHIFDDGPAPTGLRYCNNGVALKFVAGS